MGKAEPYSGRERLAHATTAPLCRSTSIGQRFWWGSGQLSWGGLVMWMAG